MGDRRVLLDSMSEVEDVWPGVERVKDTGHGGTQLVAASNQRLGVSFDKVITAEDVGAYKPRAPHFEALFGSLAEMGLDRSHLLHVAQSLFHDHEPARRYGLPSVWIDRGRGRSDVGATPAPASLIEPRWRFETLEAFADAVESQA